MITIPYGRWHEFIPNIRSGPTLAHMIIFQQWRIWGAGLFLVCYSRKIVFMQEFFTLLSFLECEYHKKRGGAGYRNGRWAGGITAVFSEHPLSLKNSYHPAVTGSPWVDSTGCNRPMSDVHPSASAYKIAPLSFCLISVVLCLGVGNIRPRKIQFRRAGKKP